MYHPLSRQRLVGAGAPYWANAAVEENGRRLDAGIYTAEQSLVAEQRMVKGRFQRVVLEAHYAGLPQTQPGRPPALAPAVEARPLRSMRNCWRWSMTELLYTRVQAALSSLQLPTMLQHLDELTQQAMACNWSALEYLDPLTQLEARARFERDVQRKMHCR